mmetsp:Transcript_21207/g.43439  ORF Transcript_21207/g.43439 Transcript_21207/m.43439 type:complete len:216 (+) Transcript_21207:655-1302(+)
MRCQHCSWCCCTNCSYLYFCGNRSCLDEYQQLMPYLDAFFISHSSLTCRVKGLVYSRCFFMYIPPVGVLLGDSLPSVRLPCHSSKHPKPCNDLEDQLEHAGAGCRCTDKHPRRRRVVSNTSGGLSAAFRFCFLGGAFVRVLVAKSTCVYYRPRELSSQLPGMRTQLWNTRLHAKWGVEGWSRSIWVGVTSVLASSLCFCLLLLIEGSKAAREPMA